MTPKGHGVIRGCDDLLCYPKGQLDLWHWPWPKGQAFDLTGDHKCPGNTLMRLGSHGVPYYQSMQFHHVHFYTPDLSGRIVVWRWRLSVCLSVRLSVHKACKHDTDRTISAMTVKLGTHITYDKRKNPIDFQGHGSKVKVTGYTLLLNLVNTIQTEPFQLGLSNLVHIHVLLMTRERTLLIFKVMGQRSRSQATHCCLTL